MRKVEHRLRLDLLRGGNQGYIRVKRGENGARRLAIALYMHSVPYMADAGTTAVFRAIKPDNKKLFDSTTITDNVVTVELTTQTVAALGTVRCELSIYGTNNELLYSPQFDVIVEDYLYSDTAVESTGEYTELTEAISKVNNIVSTEAARVAAENQRVANETARGKAETERETAETARAAAETARATAETERASAETTRASAESSRAFSENIRKQAEKQRVSSETQRDTAETARSTAESGRRSAETARVQEFNAIKADAQDAATAEATRATNEAARVAAEANRANAEQLRVALYNLWNNATASAYDSLSPSVTLSNKDGHKHFNFGIPSNSRERDEIEAGELESTALNFTGFTFYNIWEPDLEWDANISSYGLPSGINKSFVLITGPAEITEDGNIDHSWDVPQTIFDGQNIYIRRLGVSHEGLGSEDDPLVVSYYNKDWEPVGGTADAVTYTPQTLTEEQKSQARTNIGAVSDSDVNDKLPIYIKMIPVANSNNVIAEDGTTGGQILGYLGSGREVVLVYQGFTYYLSEQGTEDDTTTLTSLSFAACAKNPNGVNVLSRITYAFNKDEFSVTTEGRYIDPIDGIVKSDLADDVQASLTKADTAISLGLTAATPGQIIKVKAVQDGKPTEWEAVNPDYTLTVTVSTQDGVTVTGQTVTVRAGDADGPVYGTAEYNGQPVSFRVPDGFAYFVEVTDNLAAHFRPTTVKGVINGANAAVTLLYNDFSTIQTAPDIQAALNADMDLTELVGQQITCQRGNDTLSWDVVDYDSTAKVVTLCMHDVLPEGIQFEPLQALMYCENGLAAGSYTFKWDSKQCYFTLTQAIPAGGQLRATDSEYQTYESQSAIAQIESGTVSTDVIDGAINLGQTGTGSLNHSERVIRGSNNFGESGILQWLNSDSPAGASLPRPTKFSRPYVLSKEGFKAGLDVDFLVCIQDTVWKCNANNNYECPASLGGIAQKRAPYTVTAKFALASAIEIFGEYGGVADGSTIWDLYTGAETTDRIKYYNNVARFWLLRSPFYANTHNISSVNNLGNFSIGAPDSKQNFAVACKIAKSN